MKNALWIVLAVVVVSGGAYTLLDRTILKTYFETGDVPTQEEFSDTIDSAVNKIDDGITQGKQYNSTKDYAPGDTVVKNEPLYQAKVLTETQKEFSLTDAAPVTFRWTPLVPKPKDPVTYRLRVWQLMQGQSASTAMKSNKPIVTKDVLDASEVEVSGLYTGPCRPPYLCDFVWSVEATQSVAPSTGASSTGVVDTVPADGSATGTR